jgi:quercetin dioxygenase-like cupin family protein
MRRKLVIAAVLCASAVLASRAVARDEPSAGDKKMAAMAIMTVPADMKWGDAPAIFPPGAKMAVIEGDPGKNGPYTVRLKAGDGYKIPAHWHPTTENVTVVSGTFHVGMGDKLDESKGTALGAGGFASLPPNMNHYAWFTGDTEVQVHGMGLFQLTYANPADTPAAAKK